MGEQMKVAVFTDVRKVELREVARPQPRKGEVLVKVHACAICTWEQRIFSGVTHMPLPFVGGHEVAGTIEQLGEGVDPKKWRIGQKVAPRLEYLILKTNCLFKLSDSLPFEQGALSEPLACVTHSVERAGIELGNDVVIIGAGIMGLLHLQLARKRGGFVIVSEPTEERRALASRLGADVVIDPTHEDPVQRVKELTGGRGADVVFDTVAVSAAADQAIQMAGPMGKVIFYSSIHPDKPISISPNMMHHTELTITGSVSPSVRDFLRSTTLLSKGMMEVTPLITDIVPLDRVQQAFEESLDPKNYRIVVKFA